MKLHCFCPIGFGLLVTGLCASAATPEGAPLRPRLTADLINRDLKPLLMGKAAAAVDMSKNFPLISPSMPLRAIAPGAALQTATAATLGCSIPLHEVGGDKQIDKRMRIGSEPPPDAKHFDRMGTRNTAPACKDWPTR